MNWRIAKSIIEKQGHQLNNVFHTCLEGRVKDTNLVAN